MGPGRSSCRGHEPTFCDRVPKYREQFAIAGVPAINPIEFYAKLKQAWPDPLHQFSSKHLRATDGSRLSPVSSGDRRNQDRSLHDQ